ncbi:terminase large subunit domain-containing protein [Nonomuraea angiospora]|uniref:terminase large subunit domain-containing protein n=1 Tax=Nonomuraea angiospora TaxID=46172 RepID=UPI0029A8BC9E|nr:terminase family protein [Nonomuraea angiospora]MDX3099696.1 terminase family protein [Nonomuraea angiospora]
MADLDRLRDIDVFARTLVGHALWPHQLAVARSAARYRVICAGRQVGKSRLLAVLSLHKAFTTAGALVLIVSAGEVAAQRLLEDVAALAQGAPLLKGSVLDETKSQVTLSNGSIIMSVPASQRQIRGWAVDLLIVDEAAFIDPDIWRAAEPAIIARPGSRILLCSTPWGARDHFFRTLWQRGMDRPDEMTAAWHWPSNTSPLVDRKLLEEIRARETDTYFRREYLAEWTDESGAYFTDREIDQAVADFELLTPERAAQLSQRAYSVAAGVDWGMARDAQAVALVAPLEDEGLNWNREEAVYFVPWLEARYRCSYSDWIDRLIEVAGAFDVKVMASETNGVGAYPTEDLRRRLWEAGVLGHVAPVWSDVRRKQSGFGKVKTMLQRGQLVLPRHPELLKQLRSLEFEQTPGGSMKIAVPERAGHDDLAMALMQAISCIRPARRWGHQIRPSSWTPEHVVTGLGVRLPREPRPLVHDWSSFIRPQGQENGVEAAW